PATRSVHDAGSSLRKRGNAVKVQVIGSPGRGMRSSCGQAALYAALAGSMLLLGGCMSAPTYGTGTPATAQLASDVSNALSIAPKKRDKIAYAPRPGIVMPSSTAVLPPPQDNIASDSNPQWPESPEERRERLRAEATINRDDPGYDPAITPDAPQSGNKSPTRMPWDFAPKYDDRKNTRDAFNKRLAQTQQGSATQRRYL